MLHVAIVGSGVLGLLSAFRALQAGHRVDLIAPPDPFAISWSGTRIIRDDVIGSGRNTQTWRDLLAALGHGPIDPRPVAHLREGKWSHEDYAFCLEADGARDLIFAALRSYDSFAHYPTRLAGLDDQKRTMHLDDGQVLRVDRTIIAAGRAGRAFLPDHPAVSRDQFQVYASLGPTGETLVPMSFIEDSACRGLWGTPVVGRHAAKISASDLCFPTYDMAADFIKSDAMRAAFLTRIGQIGFPMNPDAVAAWHIETYAASIGAPLRFAGQTPVHVACDGDLFKRAPHVASHLIDTITTMEMTG